jgi:hypothetical protein
VKVRNPEWANICLKPYLPNAKWYP